jgi:hypothetical protein
MARGCWSGVVSQQPAKVGDRPQWSNPIGRWRSLRDSPRHQPRPLSLPPSRRLRPYRQHLRPPRWRQPQPRTSRQPQRYPLKKRQSLATPSCRRMNVAATARLSLLRTLRRGPSPQATRIGRAWCPSIPRHHRRRPGPPRLRPSRRIRRLRPRPIRDQHRAESNRDPSIPTPRNEVACSFEGFKPA